MTSAVAVGAVWGRHVAQLRRDAVTVCLEMAGCRAAGAWREAAHRLRSGEAMPSGLLARMEAWQYLALHE